MENEPEMTTPRADGSATVNKTTVECYEIHHQGERAEIMLKCHGSDEGSFGGSLSITSTISARTWAHHWSGTGQPLKPFLLGIDRSYLMDKLLLEKTRVFDGAKTVKEILATIAKLRRRHSLNKGEARALWREISRLHASTSNDIFIHSVLGTHWMDQMEAFPSKARWEGVRRDLVLDEPWYLTRDCENPQGIKFWEVIWPVFCDQLRREIEEVAQVE